MNSLRQLGLKPTFSSQLNQIPKISQLEDCSATLPILHNGSHDYLLQSISRRLGVPDVFYPCMHIPDYTVLWTEAFPSV